MPARLSRCMLVFAAAAVLLVGCGKNRNAGKAAKDDDPADGPPSRDTLNAGDLLGAVGKTPTTSAAVVPTGPTIPVDHKTGVTFGPSDCPVFVVGLDVYDAKTIKPVRRLTEPYEPRGHRALSPDGKFFAASDKTPNIQDATVTVWDTKTGKRVLDIGGEKKFTPDLVRFLDAGRLLIGGRERKTIDVWDIRGRKLDTRLTSPGMWVDPKKLAFSPDGTRFAGLSNENVLLLDAATGKTVATMDRPRPPAGKPDRGLHAHFLYTSAQGLAFSPDGNELALYTAHTDHRLLVWDVRGRMTGDIPLPIARSYTHDEHLAWLPDGSGWLVNDKLIDRSTMRVAVDIRPTFGGEVPPRLLGRDRLVGMFGKDRDRMQVVTLPWNQLHASLTALAGGAEAYLRPAEGVSLQFDLTNLRGDEAETRKMLSDAITQRLARDSITVADGKPTVLRFALAEKAGATLPIYETQSRFDRGGRDTGRTATEAKGSAVLELVTADGKTLWRGNLSAQSSRSFQEEVNDATVRKSMLASLSAQLNGITIPYFFPKDRKLVALPAVIE